MGFREEIYGGNSHSLNPLNFDNCALNLDFSEALL